MLRKINFFLIFISIFLVNSCDKTPVLGFITNQESNKLDIIDLSIKKKIKELELGKDPAGIYIDRKNGKVFISNPSSDNISQISLDNYSHKFIVSGRSPMSIYFSELYNLLFATNWYDHTVSVIDPLKNKVIKVIKVGNSPAGIYISDRKKKGFVANREDNTVSVIDLENFSEIKKIIVEKAPYGVFSYEELDIIFITNVQSSSITLIDSNSLDVIANIKVGKWPYQVAFNKINKLIYVTNQRDNSISVINVKDKKVIKTIKDVCEYPEGIDISYRENLLIVACWFDDNIILLDLNNYKFVKSISVSGGPRAFGKFIVE